MTTTSTCSAMGPRIERSPTHRFVIALLAVAITGCASYRATPRLAQYDLTTGYRFDSLPLDVPGQARNSDDVFVVLAFSGGGTRAAALSYGVLDQLRHVRFHWDTAARRPCTANDPPRCVARTILDEVDVITSVSGGSFTAAYYALHGHRIFDSTSTFHRAFLYHPVQADLIREMVAPRNWNHLRSRIEVAAEYYRRHIFGPQTFAALERRPRPYLILNATDANTGARFELTQEQFDLLCADLSRVPVARGVAASSAFPGLLNSMTIDSHNAERSDTTIAARPDTTLAVTKGSTIGCGYNGPGTRDGDWVSRAVAAGFADPWRLTSARQLMDYRDTTRRYLHVLDGGLADNIALGSVLHSLRSEDRPTIRPRTGPPIQGGWSLRSMIDLDRVRTIVVITVNAHTNRPDDWDRRKAGPSSFGVIAASAGILLSNSSTESITILRAFGREAKLNEPGRPRFYGVEVAIDHVPSPPVREYLRLARSNFQLTKHQVNCLADNAATLLRDASSITDIDSTVPFRRFVTEHLRGSIETPARRETDCTEAGARKVAVKPRHWIDVAVHYTLTDADDDEILSARQLGVGVRLAKRNGFGWTMKYGKNKLRVASQGGAASGALGKLDLHAVSAGGFLARRVGAVELSAGVTTGIALADLDLTEATRERFARAGATKIDSKSSFTYVVQPALTMWWDVFDRVALTTTAGWLFSRPRLRFSPGVPEPERRIDVSAYQLTAGLGWRLF